MPSRAKKIARAWLESPTQGVIELTHDWRARHLPPLTLSGGVHFAALHRVPDYTFGCESTYFVNRKDVIWFFIRLDQHPELLATGERVYLAGDFNGWHDGISGDEWLLKPGTMDGSAALIWSGSSDRFNSFPHQRYKFVTDTGRWLPAVATAPNAVRDNQGNVNYSIDPERTGQHLFKFELSKPLNLSESWSVVWPASEEVQSVPLMPGDFFYQLGTDLPMGARVQGGETVFRLFAPRAKSVELCVCAQLADQDNPHRYPLKSTGESGDPDAGVWEVVLEQNLHGWLYWYHVDGPRDAFGLFDPTHRVLDPYALATVTQIGPAIVLDSAWMGQADRSFKTPAWQDLVIAEAHVRDLVARAPVALGAEERRGFSGLRKWVEHPDFYLHRLGVNCVELQPIQENDAKTPDEYHWGYMTNNFFAPHSGYSVDPEKASGVKEFQELVAAFHARGIAVVLDVVYNHVGEPAHLMFVDRLYYFEQDGTGQLSNWSGCGNDLRCGAAMTTRLIIDSCRHLIETYGIDGFRFDLADLVSAPVLKQVEMALKRVKPDVILIAEPWSFRGHIAGELRDTGWASWNDGYRNFVRDYVRGGGTREGFEYALKGSPWYYAKWPAQTVNYTESHDDKTWIDNITENSNGNGDTPTANDRRRTHLMAATLFMSVGIPMLSSGQDFIRSKQGIHNTYQMGEVNALDYRRIYRFPSTHTYFADWIAFRRSDAGRLVRHFSRASELFFQFYWAYDTAAAAVIYNADLSQGPTQLLFTINNTLNDVTIHLGENVPLSGWRQLADHERFFRGIHRDTLVQAVTSELFVPALGCGLWVRETM
ncbi:alpha-amylase family glycosyl hydrolase [Rariglobus hedericola]|uniref:Glycoside hydrolase family 1 n=1 Tax=Rariglobus hedericola TaxID=2597822 RepID=A0A556QEQ5_9BACT|nr:alpha-amylase family glycosyl hydrolase [Rariglobus hedericola]TSJ75086.1 glycoside hydrolase family 1 [Rariglobus hedericola]